VIVTDGFHAKLPAAGTHAQFPELWPGHGKSALYNYPEESHARDAIVTWLRKRGVVFVVPVEERYRLTTEQRFRLQHDASDTVKIGKMEGASLLIAVRIDDGIIRAPSVTVTATEVETGEIVWSGSARMAPRTVADYSHKTSMGTVIPLYESARQIDAQTLSVMACHALATAFGILSPSKYQVRLDEPCG
jgi:transposase